MSKDAKGDRKPVTAVPDAGAVLASLRARAEAREGLVNQIVAVVLVAGIGAAAAVTLSPGLFAQRIPYGDTESRRHRHRHPLKANQDYDIPDEETTRRMRDEVVASVRAVYVHDASALEITLRRIHDGFRAMRAHAAEAEPVEPPPEPEDPARRAKSRKDARAEEGVRRVALHEPARDELEKRLEIRLEDAEFEQLAIDGFSEESEAAAALLVGKAMREMVVADQEELSQHRSRGIAIRRTGAGDPLRRGDPLGGERDPGSAQGSRGGGGRGGAAPGSLLPGAAAHAALCSLARKQVRSNLTVNVAETEARRKAASDAVKPVRCPLKKGQKIIGDGERIERAATCW